MKIINEARKVRLFYSLLDNLNQITATNLKPIIDYKDEQKKEKVIRKFIEISQINLSDSFNIWKNANKIASIQK